MTSLGEVYRRMVRLIRRDRYTAELEEEMRLHVQFRADRLRGDDDRLTPRAAHEAALRRFGNRTSVQERSRDMWGLDWAEHAAQDLRFAIRRLRSRPGFSLPAIAVAALGIGATTAVFSAVDAAMLRPLPFLRPSDLVTLTSVTLPDSRVPDGTSTTVSFADASTMPELFSSTAAFAAGGLNLDDPVQPRRIRAGVVTANFFTTLGVLPARGRSFAPEEGRPGGPHVVIVSDALWRGYFGGGDSLGKMVILSGKQYEVIGVMPPSFGFPSESDLWIPLSVPTSAETYAPFRGYLPSRVIARLAPGVSIDVASSRLLTRWEQLQEQSRPSFRRGNSYLDQVKAAGAAVPLQQEMVGDRKTALLILMGATLLLLLIAAANVANLLLSDGASRTREVALREVLGASRGRVIRQLLVESLLLALTGAMLGLALTPLTLNVLRAVMPADLAGTASVHIDLRVLAFATVLALCTGIVFGLSPAIGTSRVDASSTIKSGGGHGATSGRLGHTRRLLISAELALTVMLLIGSGLMLKSFHRLMSQDLGMQPDMVGTLELTFAGSAAAESTLPGGVAGQRRLRLRAILDRLNADPAIEAAGVVNDLPLRGGDGISISIQPIGVPKTEQPEFPRYLIASGGYFKALGIPMLRGRTFNAEDARNDTVGARAAIINSAMAKVYWPNMEALGRQFYFGGDTSLTYTVIGIVADVREGTLDSDVKPQMYFSADESAVGNAAIVARGSLAPAALLARITSAVHAVAPRQAVFNVRMMDEVIDRSVAPRKTNTMLIGIFGALALILSAFGVYAVVSYSVTRRTRELGIRAALGASRVNLIALVSGEMAWLVGVGLGLGLVGAWMLSRVLASLLFEVSIHDPATFIVVPVVLLAPAVIATAVPAVRAMRVNLTAVMRAE